MYWTWYFLFGNEPKTNFLGRSLEVGPIPLITMGAATIRNIVRKRKLLRPRLQGIDTKSFYSGTLAPRQVSRWGADRTRVVYDGPRFKHICENADNCPHLAERAANKPTANRYRRMTQAWTALAAEQDWHGHTAETLSGRHVDGLSEEHARSADVEDRKSQLIDGPTEFRVTRVDTD